MTNAATLFVFLGDWPSEVRASVEPALVSLEWLAPKWCHSISVRWNPIPDEDDETSSARCQVSFAYRSAKIEILPAFLSEPEWTRRGTLIHELLHISIQPLTDYTMDLAERLLEKKSPKFLETVCEELRVRNEGAVEDLTHAIQQNEMEVEVARRVAEETSKMKLEFIEKTGQPWSSPDPEASAT